MEEVTQLVTRFIYEDGRQGFLSDVVLLVARVLTPRTLAIHLFGVTVPQVANSGESRAPNKTMSSSS